MRHRALLVGTISPSHRESWQTSHTERHCQQTKEAAGAKRPCGRDDPSRTTGIALSRDAEDGVPYFSTGLFSCRDGTGRYLSSHQPKAMRPLGCDARISFQRQKHRENYRPAGKLASRFPVSTTVVPGSPRRTNALIPPDGAPSTSEASCSRTFAFGLG